MITLNMFSEKFEKVEITLSRSVRESNDTGWFKPIEIVKDEDTGEEKEILNLLNDNQLLKPPDTEKRKSKEDDGSWIDSDGLVFMYDHPAVKMTVVIVLDDTLDKLKNAAINSLWIVAQKGLRTKKTAWCLENREVKFLQSELSKGRATLTTKDKVRKDTKGASISELDETIKMLQAQKEDEVKKQAK